MITSLYCKTSNSNGFDTETNNEHGRKSLKKCIEFAIAEMRKPTRKADDNTNRTFYPYEKCVIKNSKNKTVCILTREFIKPGKHEIRITEYTNYGYSVAI